MRTPSFLPTLVVAWFTLPTLALAQSRPNILLIISDDVGFSDLSPFGGETDTPHLAALADEGMIFTNYHTPPACSPSRAQLHTGVDHHRVGLGRWDYAPYPGRDGITGYEGYLLSNNATTAELLRDAGYRTHISGKWHLGHELGSDPYRRGFEESFVLLEGGANNYNNVGMTAGWPIAGFTRNGQRVQREDGVHSDRYWTDELIRMLDEPEDERPFFAVLAFQTVHFPLQAPQDLIDKYLDRYAAGWHAARAQRYANLKALGVLPESHEPPAASLPPQPAWDSLDDAERNYAIKRMAIYAAMIEYHDRQIGRLFDFLESRNQFDNTLVVYVSDNGGAITDMRNGPPNPASRAWFVGQYDNAYENLGSATSNIGPGAGWGMVSNTPYSWHKLFPYEGGIRVPLLVRHPQGARGEASDALTQAMDVAATVLDAAGVEHPGTRYGERDVEPLQGRSLVPILRQETESIYGDDEPIVIELLGNSAVLMGDWKLIRVRSGMRGDNDWHLYNLIDDPAELHDLRNDRRDIHDRLLEAYRDYAEHNNIVPVSDDWTTGRSG